MLLTNSKLLADKQCDVSKWTCDKWLKKKNLSSNPTQSHACCWVSSEWVLQKANERPIFCHCITLSVYQWALLCECSSLSPAFSRFPGIIQLTVCVSHLVVSGSLWSPCSVAHQAPLPMEFSRQEYWSAISFSRGHPHAGVKPRPPALQADSLLSELPGKP